MRRGAGVRAPERESHGAARGASCATSMSSHTPHMLAERQHNIAEALTITDERSDHLGRFFALGMAATAAIEAASCMVPTPTSSTVEPRGPSAVRKKSPPTPCCAGT